MLNKYSADTRWCQGVITSTTHRAKATGLCRKSSNDSKVKSYFHVKFGFSVFCF